METKPTETNISPETPPLQTKADSNKRKYWIIGIVLLIIVFIAGVGYNVSRHSTSPQMQPSPTTQSSVSVSPTQGSNTTVTSGGINKSNTSNAQLDQDVQTIQGNLNQLNSDQQNANQSIQNQSNDTPQQQ